MMIAWYFATALSKQYARIVPFLETRRLDRWTHNMTIRKAIESYRIPTEQKAYLRSLKQTGAEFREDKEEPYGKRRSETAADRTL